MATIFSGEKKQSASLDNISLKGCLLQLEDRVSLPAGESIDLHVHLDPAAPDFDIKVKGFVVSCADGQLAVEFVEVGLESFQHLLRLVQFNSENPVDIENELSQVAYNIADLDKA